MPKRSSPSSGVAKRLKNYLPVGIQIQQDQLFSNDEDNVDDITYIYVKEHNQGNRDTLFVANCPVVPHLRTRVLLQALFGRYGEVQRVTVGANPRQPKAVVGVSTVWTEQFSSPSYFRAARPNEEGKFAHVVFSSKKELQKTLRSIEKVVAASSYLTLDAIELQTLRDDHTANDDDDEDDTKAIHKFARRYLSSCPDRDALMLECNQVMQEYEAEVDRQEKERKAATTQADEDGFITVSYTKSNTMKQDGLEESATPSRTNTKSRSRKKKKVDPFLTDFYRFQTKEQRKKNVKELRERFERDLAHVKKLKEDSRNRPF